MRPTDVSMENPELVEDRETSFFFDATDKCCVAPAFLNVATLKVAKTRTKMWRKEQLSQGVLGRLLAILGRVTLCQVHSVPPTHILCICLTHSTFPHSQKPYLQEPVFVLDPFAGTGSTGVAEARSGSYFFGCDTDDQIVVPYFYLHNTSANTSTTDIMRNGRIRHVMTHTCRHTGACQEVAGRGLYWSD